MIRRDRFQWAQSQGGEGKKRVMQEKGNNRNPLQTKEGGGIECERAHQVFGECYT